MVFGFEAFDFGGEFGEAVKQEGFAGFGDGG